MIKDATCSPGVKSVILYSSPGCPLNWPALSLPGIGSSLSRLSYEVENPDVPEHLQALSLLGLHVQSNDFPWYWECLKRR